MDDRDQPGALDALLAEHGALEALTMGRISAEEAKALARRRAVREPDPRRNPLLDRLF